MIGADLSSSVSDEDEFSAVLESLGKDAMKIRAEEEARNEVRLFNNDVTTTDEQREFESVAEQFFCRTDRG